MNAKETSEFFGELSQLKAGNLWGLWDDLSMTVSANRSIRGWRAAQVAKIAADAPEIGGAARFLPSEQRFGIQATAAFAEILISVLCQDSDNKNHLTSSENAPKRDGNGKYATGDMTEFRFEPESVEDGAEAASCGCSGNDDNLVQERAIATNIIEFVYHEAVSGEVGQPAIEAFLEAHRCFDIAEDDWNEFVNALADFLTRKRYATTRALCSALDDVVSPLLNLLLPVLLPNHNGQWLSDLSAGVQRGLITLGRAILLTHYWPRLKPLWIDRGNLLIPLDLIGAHGWRDDDFMSFMQQDDADPAALGFNILRDFAQLIDDEFKASASLFAELKPRAAARAVLFYALHWKSRHDFWCRAVLSCHDDETGHPEATPLWVATGTPRKLQSVPRLARWRMIGQALTLNAHMLERVISPS